MLDVCMNIVDEMVGIVVDGLEGGSVVNELEGGSVVDGLEGGSVLNGLEGGSVVNELEGGSVVDGLEGGSLVNELEGGSVVDVLEGGCVVNESVRVVDEMLVEHCFQPSDYEEEHGGISMLVLNRMSIGMRIVMDCGSACFNALIA